MSDWPVLSRAEVRQFDRFAIEQLGVPGVVLMENAGRNAADFILRLLGDTPRPRVSIVCGPGNNGGDGFVVARHLHRCGVATEVVLVGGADHVRGDARVNHDIWTRMGEPVATILHPGDVEAFRPRWAEAHALVDAMLGTGFSGEPRPPFAETIDAINALDHGCVVAIDVPSGLDCDTGSAAAHTVRAHHTITFAAVKRGLLEPGARPYVGLIHLADIGVAVDLWRREAERDRGAAVQ